MSDKQMICPDINQILSGLKDFQRDSVDYVFRRMYLDDTPARRFLVADEVGLGKTLVARGVIAKVVERLWDRQKSINIVYICSNSDIARQNVRRLTLSQDYDFRTPERITLLPQYVDDLRNNPLNFVALTPGTSFDLKNATGRKEERVLLYWMLKAIWKFHGAAAKNVFQVGVGTKHFRDMLRRFDRWQTISRSLRAAFRAALRDNIEQCRIDGRQTLKVRFNWLCREMPKAKPWRRVDPEVQAKVRSFIGELRALLAKTCIRALSPDLIILDEFQRFRNLLDGTDATGELAAKLFEWREARVILLSATPYKMYTCGSEVGEEDHYRDFLRTMDFLLPGKEYSARLGRLLKEYRRHLYALAEGDGEASAVVKSDMEEMLRSVMIRTERLAASPDRDGMLQEVLDPVRIELADVNAYVQLARIIEWLDSEADGNGLGDQIEYWKSAPYLLNFMEHYKLKHVFDEAAPSLRRRSPRARALAKQLTEAEDALLSWRAIERYSEVAPGNPKLRTLWEDVLSFDNCDLWRLLWIPPCAPYYQLRGVYADPRLSGYTKRLIFSNWKVVPKAIAILTSYAAERQMFLLFDPKAKNTLAARKRQARLLDFSRSPRRLTGMPVLGLIYPCSWFAAKFDPIRLGQSADANATLPDPETLVEHVSQEIEADLRNLVSGRPESGAADADWYWVAPILLDAQHNPDIVSDWFDQEDLAYRWRGPHASGRDSAEDSAWSEHIERARHTVANPQDLGRPPRDLYRVLAEMAMGGPATVALRAISRVCGGAASISNHEVRFAAANIGWAVRSLFNLRVVTAMIRGLNKEEPYWRRVMEYCVNGCFQSVLDEYVHLLHESHSLTGRDIAGKANDLAAAITETATLRVSQPRVDDISANADSKIEITPRIMRARFALRFGDEKSEEESLRKRKEHVRAAFNSPFWPFVLATTSIGQEGLDFHQYCHAVVHWNLPGNPVDLEQREGRIHRYKGHAVRKNVATKHQDEIANVRVYDPWQAMFEAAYAAPGRKNDLVPYWLYPVADGAMIERHVPLLPLSRDGHVLPLLKHALAVYRMVFGQPRQDDLLDYLSQHMSITKLTKKMQELRIDLTPPTGGELAPGNGGKGREIGADADHPTCPACGALQSIPIVYGMLPAELGRQAAAGKIHLGGCCVSDSNPKWYCRACGHEWANSRDCRGD